MKMWFLFFVFFWHNPGYTQGSDLLLLKKGKGQTLQTFFAGSFIHFIDISNREESGVIKKIENDTLYIIYHDIRQRYTMWGTTVLDTVTASLDKYHYNEIKAIYKPGKSFEFVRDGTLFMIAGAGYAVLHLANAAIKKEPVDGKTMAIAGGVAAAGFIMRKLRKYTYPIGTKYQLSYVGLKK
jgi:hypothetical protein